MATFKEDPLFAPLRFSFLRLDRERMTGSSGTESKIDLQSSNPAPPNLAPAIVAELTALGDFSFERDLVSRAPAAAAPVTRRPFSNLPRAPAAAAPAAAPAPVIATSTVGSATAASTGGTRSAEVWTCKECTFVSPRSDAVCGACGAARPEGASFGEPVSHNGRPVAGLADRTSAAREPVALGARDGAQAAAPSVPPPVPAPITRQASIVGGWTCGTCTFVNYPAHTTCGVCSAARSVTPPTSGVRSSESGGGSVRLAGGGPPAPRPAATLSREVSAAPPPGSWPCGVCTLVNRVHEPACTACGTPSPRPGGDTGASFAATGDVRPLPPLTTIHAAPRPTQWTCSVSKSHVVSAELGNMHASHRLLFAVLHCPK